MTRLVSSIYGMGPAPVPSDEVAASRTHAARAALWHKLGLIVVDPSRINNEWLQRALLDYAAAEYGPPGAAGRK